jgi:hypothetical protein
LFNQLTTIYHTFANDEEKMYKRRTQQYWSTVTVTVNTTLSCLVHNLKSGTALNQVPGALRLDDNASLGRVARATTSMDKKSRAAAHVVGGRGVEVIAVVHSLEGTHVTECVGALGEGPDTDLTLAGGVVAAGAGLAAAAALGVDVGAIEASAWEEQKKYQVMKTK